MKRTTRTTIAAAVFLLSFVGAAWAATPIQTNFNFVGVSVTPNSADISTATSIGFVPLPINNVVADNTGIILFATGLTLTNPAVVGVGDLLSLSWTTGSGTFTAALTESKVKGVPNTSLTVIADGPLSGPVGFASSPSELTLVFNQNGDAFSMSGHMLTTTGVPVPEASTWVMALGGFAALGVVGWRMGKTEKQFG